MGHFFKGKLNSKNERKCHKFEVKTFPQLPILELIIKTNEHYRRN